MTLRAFARRLKDDRGGNTALLFALSLPILVGMVGLGVETGFWYYKQRELQTAADVAAIAGAVEKRAGSVYSVIKAQAQGEAVEHGFVVSQGTITVNNPPTSGTNMVSNAVEVLLTMPETRFFSQIFSSSVVTMHARAVAKANPGGDACILALHNSAAGALTFTGNALALINGCNIMSNSLSSTSLYVGGSAEVTVPCAMSAGGTSTDSGLHLSSCTEPQAYQPQATDPYASTVQPDTSGTCQDFPSSPGSATFSPGRFCGGGPLKGTKHFNPGVYVIDGFDFKINSGATITGSGVTFFLTNNATTDFNGNADITLSAPTSGTYKGILFYGDPDNTAGSSKFNGTASSTLTGAIYFPSQEVEFLGNFSGVNGCMRVVASTVKFTGSTSINSDCTAYGLSQIPLPGTVTLVE